MILLLVTQQVGQPAEKVRIGRKSKHMANQGIQVPANGEKIRISNGVKEVPDHPVIPFVEGDGTGRDIWRASVRVIDAAVEKAYSGKRKFTGWKLTPERNPSINLAAGFPKRRSMLSANTWLVL
jgi:hypothetical protein